MKKLLKVIVPMIMILLVTQSKAQESQEMRKERHQEAKSHLETMKKELSLSEDQVQKIKAIFKERNEKLRTTKPSREEVDAMSDEDRKAFKIDQMKLRKELDTEVERNIKAVLSEEQVTKYEAMNERMREKMKAKRAEHRMMNQKHQHKEGESHTH